VFSHIVCISLGEVIKNEAIVVVVVLIRAYFFKLKKKMTLFRF